MGLAVQIALAIILVPIIILGGGLAIFLGYQLLVVVLKGLVFVVNFLLTPLIYLFRPLDRGVNKLSAKYEKLPYWVQLILVPISLFLFVMLFFFSFIFFSYPRAFL